jgi:prepilin-type processing-associated H-X9-DG protein
MNRLKTLICPSFDPQPRYATYVQPYNASVSETGALLTTSAGTGTGTHEGTCAGCMASPPGGASKSYAGYGSSIDYGFVGAYFQASSNLYANLVGLSPPATGMVGYNYGGYQKTRVPFPGNAANRLSDITDGLTSTAFALESSGRSMTACYGKTCNTTSSNYGGPWSSSWNVISPTGTGFDGITVGGTGPCTMNCSNTGGASSNSNIYSWHRGGTNILFGDGSVRFVSDSIPWPVLGLMLTSSNGEVITKDEQY